MKNMKFRVKSPEHSEEIQRELFRMKGSWGVNCFEVMNTDKPFLYIYLKSKEISFGMNEFYFEHHENTETTLEELKAM